MNAKFRKWQFVNLLQKVLISLVGYLNHPTKFLENTDGSVEVSYESEICCSDRSGWIKLGDSLPEPGTCSMRTCSVGNPAQWEITVVFAG